MLCRSRLRPEACRLLSTYTATSSSPRTSPSRSTASRTSPTVKRETDYYQDNITKVKSIDDFVKNDRLFRYAMKAHGLEDMTYAKAFMVKVLKEGIDDNDSFANKLSDKRYYEFVKTFNFDGYGETATSSPAPSRAPSTSICARRWRRMPASRTRACGWRSISSARRPSITIFYEVLADTALARSCAPRFGLPDSFASADIDKQVKLFEQKLDIEDFTDPEKLGKFLTRFTSLWEINNPTSTGADVGSACCSASRSSSASRPTCCSPSSR